MRPEDKQLLKASAAIKKAFDLFHQQQLTMVAEQIARLKVDANGQIINSTENMRIRAEILERYRNMTNTWIAENMAPADWIAAPSDKIPDTLAGQAVLFGRWYAEQGLKVRSPMADLIVIENLQTAVTHVTSVAAENREQLRQTLTRAIITPAPAGVNPYKQAMKQLEETFGLRPNVAETVFRGTVMETLRMTNAAAVNVLYPPDTDPGKMLYMHTGPPPIPMPGGHEFCVDNYGETMTLDEWKEVAARYGGQGGTDPDFLLEYCGGYNCRHSLAPVAPDNYEIARERGQEYKEIQQEYLQHLEQEKAA